MVSVFGVEASVVYEIDAASDDVPGGESGTVWLAGAGGAEGMSVVTMVTI